MTKILTSKVFVAGGQPALTYVDRSSGVATETLEENIRGYLSSGHKALTVTGPTKSGKTVLCRKVVGKDEAIWVSGGNIDSEGSFWAELIDKLDIPVSETAERLVTDESSRGGGGGAKVSIPGIAELDGSGKLGAKHISTASRAATKTRNPKTLALAALLLAEKPLVVDDFHYIERGVQRSVIRALKDPIFDGQRVILIAVPHRAFDAVRSEREMTGRVDQLPVGLWPKEDLLNIARQGFPALNVTCDSAIVDDFVSECQGSPHLMQEFCRQLCELNGVRQTADSPVKLKMLDRSTFFKKIAASTSKPAFDLLAQGPRQRSDRKQRAFVDGTTGDIYLAVLRAIAAAGAKSRLTYEDIRAALRGVLADDAPQAHEVSRVLVKMSEIAKDKIEGEPVLEWDEEESALYVADPFFAFYLRWAS